MAQIRVNTHILRREIFRQADRALVGRVKPLLEKKFYDEKQKLLEEFDGHAVTQELKGGANADGDIVSTSRGGNLYSYLGFAGDIDAIGDLRSDIEKNTTKGHVTKKVTANKISYSLEVRTPSLEELKRRSQTLLWINRSWIDVVEKGLGNFRRYLFDDSGRLENSSQTGVAIQIKHDIGKRKKLKSTPYVSELLKKFRDRIVRFTKR